MSESKPSSASSSLGAYTSERETHGRRDDIEHVKAPNLFERAKEEIEAIVEAIHPKKEALVVQNHSTSDKVEETKQQSSDLAPPPEKSSKSVKSILEKAKHDIEAKLQHKKDKSPDHHHHHHHKETHGRNDEIDENTPIVEVKGPNVFERAKEEFEAAFEALHPKKDSVKTKKTAPKKQGGLPESIGKSLEKICSPGTQKD